MADSDDDSGMFFEEPPQPSCFMRSLVAIPPKARRPQTINTTNPINRAEAYPPVSNAAREVSTPANIGIRMPNLADNRSYSLASTKLGRPNTYRSRDSTAKKRNQAKETTSDRNETVNEASVRTRSPSTNSLSSNEDEEAIGEPGTGSVTPDKSKPQQDPPKIWQGANVKEESDIEIEDVTPTSTATAAAFDVASEESSSPAPSASVARATGRASPVASASPPAAEVNTVMTEAVANRDSQGQANTQPLGTPDVVRKRDTGMRLPKSLDEAGEADRMLWEWRNAGRPWREITPRWTKLTGRTPGKSSLSVRFSKLQHNFAESGGADDILLLRYKAEAEAELETEMWSRVAVKIKQNHNIDTKVLQLRRRFLALKQSGFAVGVTLDSIAKSADDDQSVALTGTSIAGTASANAGGTDAQVSAAARDDPFASTQPRQLQGAFRASLVDYSDSDSDIE